jgi:hypothetical protein
MWKEALKSPCNSMTFENRSLNTPPKERFTEHGIIYFLVAFRYLLWSNYSGVMCLFD